MTQRRPHSWRRGATGRQPMLRTTLVLATATLALAACSKKADTTTDNTATTTSTTTTTVPDANAATNTMAAPAPAAADSSTMSANVPATPADGNAAAGTNGQANFGSTDTRGAINSHTTTSGSTDTRR